MAETQFALETVDAALSGADIAGGQLGFESKGAPLQLSGAVQTDVARFYRYHRRRHRERHNRVMLMSPTSPGKRKAAT